MSMGETSFVDVSDLQRVIRRLEAKGKSLSRFNPQIAAILVTAVEDEFDTEGHGNWPELAPETIARRRKGGAGAKILQDTSNLVGSMRPDFGADFASAATDVPYAIFHVSKSPRKKIPLRDFLAIDEDSVLTEIEDLLVAELVR